MSTTLTKEESKQILTKIEDDIIRPLTKHYGLKTWLLSLGLILCVFGYAYFIQLRDGLGVTAMNDYVSWGLYISNFVFWVATSLVGMLISSVMGLLNIKWVNPITRVAEIVALAFVMWAGLVIIFDMGRPDRLINILIHGRPQSPIVWDLVVVMTYTAISFLLLFLPMIPDIAILKKRMTSAPKWQKKLYNILSLGWIGTPEQYKIIHRSVRILLVLVIPVAISIHTVTSWLFATTLRPGWDSTIFGPYFVSGAFPAGVAAVMIALYIFRSNFKLHNYFTEEHFDKLSKLMVMVLLVYLYFNINEFLVPAYKMRDAEGAHISELFTGSFAPIFWFVQLFGLVFPIILLLFSKMRKPGPSFTIAIFILLGAYFKRYLIVVPTMLHPYLPMQNVPENWYHYFPTTIEIAITLGSLAGTILTITLLAKLFPIVPIAETAEEQGVKREDIFNQ